MKPALSLILLIFVSESISVFGSDEYRRVKRLFVCVASLGTEESLLNKLMQVFERTEKHIDIVIPQTQQKFDERPTVVLIHGWKGVVDTHRYFHFSSQGFDDIGRTFEKYHNVNVVRVEWGNGVVSSYGTAVRNLPEMAQEVATFLDEKLGKSPVLWRNLTIVGHSLGAQMSGLVGKAVRNGKIGTIIGLDPAGPKYEEASHAKRLDKSDAEYVECIHTSTDCYGTKKPVCTADFYPNSGYQQAGCAFWKVPDYTCDHSRAHEYYRESITGVNKFRAMKCKNFLAHCDRKHDAFMGGYPGNLGRDVEGTFYVSTADEPPFGKG